MLGNNIHCYTELNRPGTPFSNWKFEAKLEEQSQSFHACKECSINHDINTRDLTSRHACREVRFGFKKNIGSLSEGSVPVIFISMVYTYLSIDNMT